MNIGILGGTFDPPHFGHLEVARNTLETGLVDEVWFVPCLIHRFAKSPAPFEDRLAMCELMLKDEPNTKVSDFEKTLTRPGYALDLIVALKAVNPGNAFRLIAGTDIWFERESWFKYDEVIKHAPPIYVKREGTDPIPEPTLPMPPGISSSEVRGLVEKGKKPLDMIPEPVLEYIIDRGLYRRID